MVQLLLKREPGRGARKAAALACMTLLLLAPAMAASRSKTPATIRIPVLLLDGGRKLTYERSFDSARAVNPKPGFWTKLVNVAIGEPDYHTMVRPYSVVTDSKGRIIVTDPGAGGVHIFDFAHKKYKFLSHSRGKDAMFSPQCVAVDAKDNIYVTDSNAGKIFVFGANGKFERVIGSLKGGEGYFKRPTGIAVDSEADRIYVTDTLRNQIFVLDLKGDILQTIGKSGTGPGEFNFPTELRLEGKDLLVVDAMNFRVQVLNRAGVFQYAIGHVGDGTGAMFRPKGIGEDSEGHLYIVDGLYAVVQVFDREGQLLYYFGQKGTGFGDFQLPTGLFIDGTDHVFVVDSYNRRVQEFHYFGLHGQNNGGTQ